MLRVQASWQMMTSMMRHVSMCQMLHVSLLHTELAKLPMLLLVWMMLEHVV